MKPFLISFISGVYLHPPCRRWSIFSLSPDMPKCTHDSVADPVVGIQVRPLRTYGILFWFYINSKTYTVHNVQILFLKWTVLKKLLERIFVSFYSTGWISIFEAKSGSGSRSADENSGSSKNVPDPRLYLTHPFWLYFHPFKFEIQFPLLSFVFHIFIFFLSSPVSNFPLKWHHDTVFQSSQGGRDIFQ